MGFGASKIDYKERDFTEQPLEEEEIEVLLKALPEENVIDSIDNDGREKILKAMSDQNVFNIRGDNIFDYYLTNKREIIKGCMTSHINRDGTPCPDEKFNRMISTIPNLVQGPLGEKETEWDTERQSLESKYNTLDTAKTDLQGKYDTLQPQYDTLNDSKNELQTQYDKLNTQKTELIKYRDILVTEKGDLESEIQKNLLSNVVTVTDGNNTKTVSEQQCKAYAKSLGELTYRQGNDTSGCYLAPSGVGTSGVYYTKKTGKGKCYYNSDSDYRVCIQNNLNRNNTYSKEKCKGNVGGEYDCRVDGTWDQITVKGWDRNKYGQTLDAAKHFCNTHKDCVAVASAHAAWNWPVHTTSKFKPCNKYREVGSGSPDLSITKEECKAHAKSIGRPFYHDSNHAHYALGCSRWLAGNDIYWSENPDASDKKCGHGGHHCIKKEICDPKVNYHNKRECKKPIDGVWSKGVGESCEWECPGRSGIEKYTVPKFHANSSYACSARDYTYDKEKGAHSGGGRKLVQGSSGHFSCRAQDNSNYGWTSYKHQDDRMTHKSSCSDWDNPAIFYKEVSNDEEPSLTVSEEECKAYADTHGLAFGVHDDTPSSYKRIWNGGCYCGSPYGGIDGRYGSITDERRYTGGWSTANGYTDEHCKDKCLNKVPESKVVQGCSRLPVSKYRSNKKDVVVYVKNAREEPIKCGPSTTGKCIQKQYTKEDFKTVSSGNPSSKYKDVSSGKNNRSVSESECRAYAETIPGYGYSTVTNTDRPHGCYHSGKQYRYAANGTTDCGDGSDICIQKTPTYVSEQQCKAYAKLMGKELRTDVTDRLSGCSVGYDTPNSRDKIGMVYYGPQGNNNTCGSKFSGNSYFSDCVQIK